MVDVRVYVDTEYVFPGMSELSGRPTSRDKREIVQVAAVKFDNATGRELECFDRLIKPTITKFIPPFFEKLTSISSLALNEGDTFVEVMKDFALFCGSVPVWTFDKDFEVFEQNFLLHQRRFPFSHTPFIRVKPLLSSFGIDAENYSSGTLYQAVGLEMQGQVHNALHDVRSMAKALHVLEQRKE